MQKPGRVVLLMLVAFGTAVALKLSLKSRPVPVSIHDDKVTVDKATVAISPVGLVYADKAPAMVESWAVAEQRSILGAQYQTALAGVPQALVPSGDLTDNKSLDSFRTIILSSQLYPPTSQVRLQVRNLRTWVESGGTLIVFANPFAFDDKGVVRSVVEFDDLIGLKTTYYTGSATAELKARASSLETKHIDEPLAKGRWGSYIGSPMNNDTHELFYIKDGPEEHGVAFERALGAGKVLWFGWPLGASFDKFALDLYPWYYRAIQQAEFGQVPEVTLLMSTKPLIYAPHVDGDGAGNASTLSTALHEVQFGWDQWGVKWNLSFIGSEADKIKSASAQIGELQASGAVELGLHT